MKWIDTINCFLATSIGWLNAGLAVFLILFTTALSIEWIGGFGIFIGPILGAAFAVVFCGVLALLIKHPRFAGRSARPTRCPRPARAAR